MRLTGVEIAKMHAADIVHGDLTTSNMMLRRITPPSSSSMPVDNVQLVSYLPRTVYISVRD